MVLEIALIDVTARRETQFASPPQVEHYRDLGQRGSEDTG